MKDEIYLRPLCEEDAKTSWHWRNDPRVWANTGSRPDREVTETMELDWIRKALSDPTRRNFAIVLKNGDRYVGNAYLTDIQGGGSRWPLHRDSRTLGQGDRDARARHPASDRTRRDRAVRDQDDNSGREHRLVEGRAEVRKHRDIPRRHVCLPDAQVVGEASRWGAVDPEDVIRE